MSDETFFGTAAREFSSGAVDENLLAKARVLAKGDQQGTEIEYIKLRVEQLKSDERHQFLAAVSGSAATKLASARNVLRCCFDRVSRNHVMGIAVMCIVGVLAALLLTNEITGACARLRLAQGAHQDWIIWMDDQGIDIQDMQTAPYVYLEQKYGSEAADTRGNFHNSERGLEVAERGLTLTKFCFAQ